MPKLRNTTQISITKTWFQQPSGYEYPMHIRVPNVPSLLNKKMPAAILLHGAGTNGLTMINQWASILTDHVLIAPSGYKNSWNIAHEESKAPDIDMLQSLITLLKSYDNIDGTKIRILGYSNGAALANRAYVQLDDTGVDQIVTIAAAFFNPMYRDNSFYIPATEASTGVLSSNYPTVKVPYRPRKFISFHGQNETLFPYVGGFKSEFGYTFLSAQASAFAVAKGQGYTGIQIADNIGSADIGGTFKYTYDTPNGDVLHYKYPGGHEVIAAIKTLVQNNFAIVHANQPDSPTIESLTKWNVSKLNISNAEGTYPSTSAFTFDGQVVTATSNGDPYPALAGQENTNTGVRTFGVNTNIIKQQNFKFRIKNRAGENTANPQITDTTSLGVLANGVTFTVPSAGDHKLPGTVDAYPPLGFNYNRAELAQVYGNDAGGGFPEDSGVYQYVNGSFLTTNWKTNLLYIANSYYNQTSYIGDKFRHIDGHSKILGYCFDGYPIYGPYGYATGTDNLSEVIQMTSSYKLFSTDNHRPPEFKYDRKVNVDGVGEITLSAGSFIQDYEFKNGHGTLDRYNGRYTITPDFPNGTYAYFLTFNTVDGNISSPAYPYIVGNSTKQNRTLVPEEVDQYALDAALQQSALWNIATGTKLTNLIERSVVNITLPIANGVTPKVELISGSLPTGTRIEGTSIVGTVYEVSYDTTFTAVLRATYKGLWEDRTIEFDVTGPDDPVWGTSEGSLPIGPNNTFYILDSASINFQLQATDTDLSAGDSLSYFIAEGDGSLPPGITMSETGLLTGITDPLLSLDKRFEAGGYDQDDYGYGTLPLDYGIKPDNGFSSFFYDSQIYDFSQPTINPRKLNRYYPFAVTVTDGDTFVRREFNIYVVGDDFLKADNTLMKSSNGVFKSDATNVRKPTWITPGNLGFRRANNYQTIFLDIVDNTTLEGKMFYNLEDVNDDGTVSLPPPGLTLDKDTGELVGRIPYQPAITKDYKFTVRATRMTSDLESVSVFGTYYEDTLLGKTSFKIGKLNLTGALDGVNDLFELVNRQILLETQLYTVTNVDDRNTAYDELVVDQTLAPSINLIPSRTAFTGVDHVYVSRLSEEHKDKYNKRYLRFTETEKYQIQSITPYIEYLVTQTTPADDPIYPAGIPRDLKLNENYFIGDIVRNSTSTGGDGKIYRCTTAHTVTAQMNGSNIVYVNSIAQLVFTAANWTEIADTNTQLSLADRVLSLKQVLESTYNGPATVEVLIDGTWRLKLPSTATSRILSNIRDHFALSSDSTQMKVTLVRDNEDRIAFDVNLTRDLTQGNNYGIALFKGDSFSEDIIVANTKDIPSTTKTFTVKIIGEIDSTIQWITPASLGTIGANYISNLKVEAQTTVPDTLMLYTIKKGKLPFGMSLATNGEILGKADQFADVNQKGLTTFEKTVVTWDGVLPGDTTFDRKYKFTVEARDRFGYTAIEREFDLTVSDADPKRYTDIYMRPMLPDAQRLLYSNFISDRTIFDPDKIYRAEDPNYGIKTNLDMLVYAGIEAKKIEEFVKASAKNHKRKKYILGDFKTAKATIGIGSAAKDIYEVVYIEVIDPANAKKGKTKSNFEITTGNKITVDSVAYSPKDDESRFNSGYDALPVYTRGVTKFVFEELEDTLIVQTKDSSDSSENQFVNTDMNDFEVTLKQGGSVTVTLELTDSEPQRFRPNTNTIKTDMDAIKVSQGLDNKRYISSIDHMRDNIRGIGASDRSYLPLWMRTPQTGFQELDYVTAIPICYCKPGQSAEIIKNITNNGFDTKKITFDIDRYIVKSTEDIKDERYILFANYQFNV